MKIAFTCPYDMSRPGGVKEIVVQVSKRLEKEGIQTKIITVKPKRKIDLPNDIYFGTSIPIEMNGSQSDLAIQDFSKNLKLYSFLEKENFDYVCIQEPEVPFLNWEVLMHSNAKNIGWFHSTALMDLNKLPYSVVTFPLGFWMGEHLDGLIAASPTVVKTWSGIFDDREKLILPAGTDVKKYAKAAKINLGPQLNILFVGRLEERKGVYDAINAFSEIFQNVNSKLWIIGKGPQEQEAHALVSKLGLTRSVEFLGRVTDHELHKYYKSSDVFMAPSIGGESVGIVLLDAMAAGIPVVGYNNPGYKFTLTGNPWKEALVGVGKYKALAKSVLEIVSNNSLRTTVTAWQKEKVLEFDWESVTSRFLKYIMSL